MSDAVFPGGHIAEDGEFAGWSYWQGDPYETRSGPFYTQREEDGSYVCAFRAEERHMNGAGFMHGGCLLTFADYALFSIATDELAGDMAVTMNLSGDFLDSAQNGQLIEARGEVTRAGGRTIYVRGLVTADGKSVLSFTGIIAKVRRKG
ncbi:PaaI family thioesterase [Erythrobacteraceae bacterium WH01K]|nr:PaaI family thioesterase [Erythrobacteraceae bacterium WH01K]